MNLPDPVSPYLSTLRTIGDWIHRSGWSEDLAVLHGVLLQGLEELTGEGAEEALGSLPAIFHVRITRVCQDLFLSTTYESSPSNPLEQFLEEEASKFDTDTIKFLEAFRTSSLDLYRFLHRMPTGQIVLQQVFGKNLKLTIAGSPASLLWTKGDMVAARILQLDGTFVLGGEALAFDQQWSDQLLKALSGLQLPPKTNFRLPRASAITDDATFPVLEFLSLCIWIISSFPILNEWDRPSFGEGSDNVYVEVTIPMLASSRAIFDAIEGHPDFKRPPLGLAIWFNYRDQSNEDEPLKGAVWLSQPNLLVTGYCRKDVGDVTGALIDLLGDQIGEPEFGEQLLDLGD